MEEVQVVKLFKSDKNKEGQPLTFNKNGKQVPYTRVAIQTSKHADKWLSAMFTNPNDPLNNLAEGERVKINVKENGQYLNFTLASRLDLLEERVEALEVFIKAESGTPPTEI